jgi:hypothetical protein
VKRFSSFKRNKKNDNSKNKTEVGIIPITSSLKEINGREAKITISANCNRKNGALNKIIIAVNKIKNPMMQKVIARIFAYLLTGVFLSFSYAL